MQNYIYGAGGHGKVVLDAMQVADINCAGFVDDKVIPMWAGLSVYPFSSLTLDAQVYLHLAIGNCKTREAIAIRLMKVKFFSVYHPAAVKATSSIVGLGTFLAAQAIVGPDAIIGEHCIINHSAVVDHDCIIGDFSHIAPLSSLGGGAKIGKGVFVGAGAVVLPGVVVEDYAVIGAGAVVIKNVATGITLVGNPAKPLN